MVKIKPYEKPSVVLPSPVDDGVTPVDLPGVDGYSERKAKLLICRIIDRIVDYLLMWKQRLRANPNL